MLKIGKLNIKIKSQLLRTMFLEKCGILDLYDMDQEKRFIMDHEKLQFNKNYDLTLFGNPEEPDNFLLNREYFCIHDDFT